MESLNNDGISPPAPTWGKDRENQAKPSGLIRRLGARIFATRAETHGRPAHQQSGWSSPRHHAKIESSVLEVEL